MPRLMHPIVMGMHQWGVFGLIVIGVASACASSAITDDGGSSSGANSGSGGSSAAHTGSGGGGGFIPGTGGAQACQSLMKRVTDKGPDGTWGTNDDVVSGAYLYFINAEGQLHKTHDYNDPGADLQWGTDDDHLRTLTIRDFLPDGLPMGSRVYDGAGADGVWGTNDDEASARETMSYDAAAFTQTRRGFSAGPDKVLETADDQALLKAFTEFDGAYASGKQLRTTYYEPGPDAIYDTADDYISFTHQYDFSSEDYMAVIARDSPGVDGVWWTSDDVIFAVLHQGCLDNDQQSFFKGFGQAGPDGIWNTADDPVGAEWIAEWDGCGFALCGDEVVF